MARTIRHTLTYLILMYCCPAVTAQCDVGMLQSYRDSLHIYNDAFLAEKSLKRAEFYLEKISQEKWEDCEDALWVRSELGIALQMNKQYEKGLLELQSTIIDAERLGYYRVMTECHLTIALIHEFLGRGSDCGANLEKAKSLIEKHNIKESYPRFCVRYSSYSRFYLDRDIAKQYAEDAVTSALAIGDKNSELDGLLLLGMFEKDVDRSVSNFTRAAELFVERSGYDGAASQILNAAQVLMVVGQNKKAKAYIRQAKTYLDLQSEKSKDFYSTQSVYYEAKKEIMVAEGKLDSALHYAELQSDSRELSYQSVDQVKITEVESQFAAQREIDRNMQLEKDARILKIALYLGLFVLGLLTLLSYYLWKNRTTVENQNAIILKKNTKLIASNNENKQLISEVHHRVKNNLQVLIGLLELQKNKEGGTLKKESVEAMISRIYSIAAMYDISHVSDKIDQISLRSYIENIVSYQSDGLLPEQRPLVHLDAEHININLDTSMPIGIMMNELISNSIKHGKEEGKKLSIKIEITKSEDYIQIKYSDNGPGIPEATDISKSLGLYLIKAMTQQLRGTVSHRNDNGISYLITLSEKISAPPL